MIRENYDPEYFTRVVAECSRENVESTINTTYLQDLFGVDSDVDESQWTALGERLRDAWRACAETNFPNRKFAATFAWYSEDGDPGVTLFQVGRTRVPNS